MRSFLLAAGLVVATTGAALAESPTTGEIYRDSDGYVISIIYGPGGPDGIPEYYWRGGVVYLTTLEATSTTGGTIVEFAAVNDSGVLPATVSVAGTDYAVEQSGGAVYLRDPETGNRYATETRRVAAESSVNPQRFGLD